MTQQELQMVLDTIIKVSSTAGYAGIAWILVHYFAQVVQIIAMPIAFVLIARYGFNALGKYQERLKQANPSDLEATRQEQIKLEKSKVEASVHKCKVQLCAIAKAAGYVHSEYSGVYDEKDVAKLITEISKLKQEGKL